MQINYENYGNFSVNHYDRNILEKVTPLKNSKILADIYGFKLPNISLMHSNSEIGFQFGIKNYFHFHLFEGFLPEANFTKFFLSLSGWDLTYFPMLTFPIMFSIPFAYKTRLIIFTGRML